MAIRMKASRIFYLPYALALVLASSTALSQAQPLANPRASVCISVESTTIVGPAITIAQAESFSLAALRDAPSSVPKIPFGHQNSEWFALKQSIQPGDTVHEFRNEHSGGYLILRNKCLVGQLFTWLI
jgi:hypothetical protein